MSSEHIRFITVGFADMINNLPDEPDVMASDPSLQNYWPDDPDAHDLCERDLWDASRDAPDPDTYEQKDQPDD